MSTVALALDTGRTRSRLLAAEIVAASLVLARVADRRSQHRPSDPLSSKGGFRLLLNSRYLLLIALMVLIFNAGIYREHRKLVRS